MGKKKRPPAEEIVRYAKDPATKIATITLDRADQLNAPTSAARLRYAELLHRANVDDDVKVLVIRGVGDDFGGGADLPEWAEVFVSESAAPSAPLSEFKIDGDEDVTYPPRDTFRYEALYCQWRRAHKAAAGVFRNSRRSAFWKSKATVTVGISIRPQTLIW